MSHISYLVAYDMEGKNMGAIVLANPLTVGDLERKITPEPTNSIAVELSLLWQQRFVKALLQLPLEKRQKLLNDIIEGKQMIFEKSYEEIKK